MWVLSSSSQGRLGRAHWGLPGAGGQVLGPREEATREAGQEVPGAAPSGQVTAPDTSLASRLAPSQDEREGCLIMVPPGPPTVSLVPGPFLGPLTSADDSPSHSGRSIPWWLLNQARGGGCCGQAVATEEGKPSPRSRRAGGGWTLELGMESMWEHQEGKELGVPQKVRARQGPR